jgi:electron transfer flavoprotein beta subunit
MSAKRIVVCVKDVLDPEIPASAFRVDDGGRTPVVVGVPAARVMDSYAENALETAIQLRARWAGSRVIALCLGGPTADDVLRRALAFTADEAVRTWDPAWAELDALGVAHVLAGAMRALGGADLVLCGRQASDIEQGLVGPALAEELGAALVTVARKLVVEDGSITVEREVDGLVEKVGASLPAVVTMTSSESNVPRMLKVKDVMLSRGKPIRVLGAAEVKADPARAAPRLKLERLYLPETGRDTEILQGETPQVLAAALVQRLRARKVI